MIEASTFVAAAKLAGFSLYTGVPCSYVKPFINYVIDSDDLTYIGATNEGDAVAIAAGAELGGKHAIVMMQNSGLGNAVSPLTSLNAIFRVPSLLIITLRGEPGGPADEPQHEVMGQITTKMLEVMGIGWTWFPQKESDIAGALERAITHMQKHQTPFALVMKKDSVAPHARAQAHAHAHAHAQAHAHAHAPATPGVRPSREESLLALQRATTANDIVIATTGFTGRELYACEDRPNQLYVVGSMGCASSIALGLAWARPDKRVIVIDGDGAMLMRMGALATIGHERPKNLVHVLLDNEAHESTGGQATVTQGMDLACVAEACGYPKVDRIARASELEAVLHERSPSLRFVYLKTRHGTPSDLPRPKITPREVKERLQKHLEAM